jgi:starch phosphorylase
MKHALRVAGQHFTARRMVRQYVTECYAPAIKGQLPGDDPPTA